MTPTDTESLILEQDLDLLSVIEQRVYYFLCWAITNKNVYLCDVNGHSLCLADQKDLIKEYLEYKRQAYDHDRPSSRV